MPTTDRGPTLTDPTGMGGVNAQDGFDYQVWECLVRLPAWLRNPAFETVIVEGLEDIEARFFAPHAPEHRLLERLQAKSGDLAPKDVKDIFERFRIFEKQHPRVTRVHTLVTPQLPPALKWVARDAARVRRARPFYAPFVAVRAASDDKLAQDFVAEFGYQLGTFVADGIEVTERPMPSRQAAFHAFAAALTTSFADSEFAPRKVAATFDALEALVRRSIGVPLARQTLVRLLESELGEALGAERAFPIHVRSSRSGESDSALEIDATELSATSRRYPEAARWQAELIAPLDLTAAWLGSRQISRITLTGSYRLTTAFLLGHAFRSAIGFEIEIPTRDGRWPTDDRPVQQTNDWSIAPPTELHDEGLVAAVGLIRRPSDDLKAGGIDSAKVLDAFCTRPLTGAREAQAGVAIVKAAVTEAASRLRAKRIDLYYAGPAAFAVALGHRWNAMLPTRLFEFDGASRCYVQTATCG